MGIISSTVDRLLHTTAEHWGRRPTQRATEMHRRLSVVDLVVGTALFRASLLEPAGRGHVDLPRLQAAGLNVVGLTIATRFPDLRGTLSAHHFRSLGAPRSALNSNMAIAEWLITRIAGWCEASAGRLRLLLTRADLEACLRHEGPLGVFIGVQGGHTLEGQLVNVERLRRLGVRMLAPAHVMDNDFVGSGTGRQKRGLSGLGRELVAELEQQRLLVDLAHMSAAGIEQSLALVGRPPVLSHTGLARHSGRPSRLRRYSPATRNAPDWVVREVGRAGGVVGIVLSTQLLGGETIEQAVASFVSALELAGSAGVAIGSDMDGGLRMVLDAGGLPLLTDGLLSAGVSEQVVGGVLGGNALRVLSGSLEPGGTRGRSREVKAG